MALTTTTEKSYQAIKYVSTAASLTSMGIGVAAGSTSPMILTIGTGGLAAAGATIAAMYAHDKMAQKIIAWSIGRTPKKALQANTPEKIWALSQTLMEMEKKIDHRLEAIDDPKSRHAAAAMGAWKFSAEKLMANASLIEMPKEWEKVQQQLASRVDMYERLLTSEKAKSWTETSDNYSYD